MNNGRQHGLLNRFVHCSFGPIQPQTRYLPRYIWRICNRQECTLLAALCPQRTRNTGPNGIFWTEDFYTTEQCVRDTANDKHQGIDMATRRRNRRRPAVDPRIEELEETKRLCTDFFGELRRGFAYGYDPNRRGDIIDNIVHPKHGRWRGMQDPFRSGVRQPQVTRARAMFAAAIPQTPGRLAPRAKQRLQDAYSATFRLNQNFTPAHVTFRKILGYGGFGVAALFGLHDSTGREVTTVVKADLRPGHGPGDTIKTEKKNLVLMSGAKHVVQRTLLIAFPWPDDVPMRIDYFWAATRFLIKLFIFHLKVITLFMLTSLQITIWLVENFMELVLGVRMVAEGDDPDAADNQDPQPAAAQPDPAQPDDAEQPPAEADPQIGPIPSLQSWNMKKLWPDWPKAPPRALGIDGSIRQNRIELDAREDIISMEYLKFGDLGKWIGKMTVENNTEPESVFSERLAWIIFECLWRGCVALAYPTGFYQGNDPMAVQIPQVTESSETSAVGPEDPMVHFDLDPQNSMNMPPFCLGMPF